MLKQLSKFVAALWLILPLASAQQIRVYGDGGNWTQEITGSLAMVKNLKIKVYSGSEDRARKEFENYKISAYVHGDTAWVVGDWQGGRPHKFSGDFVIDVPREMDEVKIGTEGGDVVSTGTAGRLDAESGGGSIHIDDIGGSVHAETGGGSIDVGNVASDVSLHTGGGSIKVNSAKGKIEAESGGGTVTVISGLQGAVLETGGGSIQVERCAGSVKASTGGGSIDLGDIGGPAEEETGGGSIRLSSAKGTVHAE